MQPMQGSPDEAVQTVVGFLQQRAEVLRIVRRYNPTMSIIQNLDIGHTAPQICLPVGGKIVIEPSKQSISVEY